MLQQKSFVCDVCGSTVPTNQRGSHAKSHYKEEESNESAMRGRTLRVLPTKRVTYSVRRQEASDF
jgi:hypothetical protein